MPTSDAVELQVAKNKNIALSCGLQKRIFAVQNNVGIQINEINVAFPRFETKVGIRITEMKSRRFAVRDKSCYSHH